MADPFDMMGKKKPAKATPKKIVRESVTPTPSADPKAFGDDFDVSGTQKSTPDASAVSTTGKPDASASGDAKKTGKPDASASGDAKKPSKPTTSSAGTKKKAPVKKKRRRRRKSTTREKTQVKQGSKLSASRFFIGCGVFLLIFMGLMIGGVFWVINDPTMLEGLGMDTSQIKTLLYLFSSLFFGILTLGFLFWLFLNIYRLATRKDGKLKYIVGLIFSFLLLSGLIVGRVYAVNQINQISTNKLVTKNPVLSYVETKDGPVFAENGIPLIAPLTMNFKLNQQIFDTQIRGDIGSNAAVSAITLDCGNGQVLTMNANGNFVGRCLFVDKQSYDLTMNVDYRSGNQNQTKTYAGMTFTPEAAIQVEPLDGEARYNDDKDEYIIGEAPVPVRFKSELLFTDLKLSDDNILRDFDADGTVEYENQASFQTSFDDSRLHKIAYQLPDLRGEWKDTWFMFDLRVIESQLAGCQLTSENIRDNKWKIRPEFDERLQIGEYRYTIYDLVNETVVASPRTNDATGALTYDFPEGAKYEVQMKYVTRDKKTGSCRSVEVNEGYEGNKANFTVSRKHNEDDPYTELSPQTSQAARDGAQIYSTLIPSTFQLNIFEIFPDPDASVKVYFNERELFAIADNIYEFEVNAEGQYQLEMEVTSQEGTTSEQSYPLTVSRNSVEALIGIKGELVGEDPFEIELDASISPLYDEEDEIVFFSRDFGDGKNLTKVSQGKVRHTYTFDTENDRGEFYPSVTVQTRKGYESTYKLSEPIVVKRKQKEVEIFMDSHPTQQAKIGEVVRMSVRTDGLVDKIQRDFGNNKVVSCESRECSSTAVTYDEEGIYEVRVEVSYQDSVPAISRVKVRVF